MAASITVATINVQGLKNASKDKVMKLYELIKCFEIVLLCETHIKNESEASVFSVVFDKQFKSLFSYATNESPKSGVVLLINRKSLFSNEQKQFEICGRCLAIKCIFQNKTATFLAVYGPGNRDQRQPFYSELLQLVETNDLITDVIVCLGDFNFVENGDLDRTINTTDRVIPGKHEFLMIKQQLGLVDIFRSNNPQKRLYTFFSKIHKTQARLDRIYVSKRVCDNYKNCTSLSLAFSDHNLFSVEINTKYLTKPKGPSYWKLNVTLLNSDLAKVYIRNKLLDFNEQRAAEMYEGWEAFKIMLAEYFKWLGKACALQLRFKTTELEQIISECKIGLQNDPDSFDLSAKLKKCQFELQTIQYRRAGQIVYSSHYRDLLFDRVSVQRAKSLQKLSAESRIIDEIVNMDGRVVTENSEIIKALLSHYQTLFSVSNVNVYYKNLMLASINKQLGDADKGLLEGYITQAEIKKAIKSFKNGKCPGSDGFPVEFYVSHIDLFSKILCKV